MSGSDRGKFSKVGLKRSIAVALLFVVALTVAGGYVQLVYYKQAADQSAKHQAWAENEVGRGCPSLDSITKAQCAYQAIQTSQENQRAEYDLYAQRTSALWAAIMAFAALLGIGLSGVGVWLVKITFEETKRGNEIAVQDASTNAYHLNQARDTAVSVDRAVVAAAKCILRPPPLDIPGGFMAQIKVKNKGAKPRKDCSH